MIFTLYKNHFKTLNRSHRKCKEKNFNWRNCQDEMFYLRKGELKHLQKNVVKCFLGCQDPWNFNPNVPLEACANITHIRWLEICDLYFNIGNIFSEAHTTGVQQKWAGMNPSGADPTWLRGRWLLRGRINKKKI